MIKNIFKTSFIFGLYNYYNSNYKINRANCCGIVGYLNNKKNSSKFMISGINLLQNRGYDSCGISSVSEDNKLITDKLCTDFSKKIDCIEKIGTIINEKYSNVKNCIGHTRWATCGKVIDSNSHPHNDYKNRISLIHNGTIFNHSQLKEEILKENKDIIFYSETDTEVIANYIGYYLDMDVNIEDAFKKVISKLEGTFGIVMIDKSNSDKMYLFRKGSPLIVGFDKDGYYIGSEKIVLFNFTKEFITWNDDELIVLDLNNIKIKKNRIQKLDSEYDFKLLVDNDHYYEQEIKEQSSSIIKALGNYSRLFEKNGDYFCKLGGLDNKKFKILLSDIFIFIGCGTSYNACLFTVELFKYFQISNNISAIEASNFSEYDLPNKENFNLFCYSQSGETSDIHKILKLIENNSYSTTIGVINVIGSLISQIVDCGVYINCGKEFAVAATKSFTNQIVISFLLAIWFSNNKNIDNKSKKKTLYESLFKLSSYSNAIITRYFDLDNKLDLNSNLIYKYLNKYNPIKDIIEELAKYKSLFILSKGFGFPIAREGALKIKELSYIHCEAISSGELKHGPLSMIDSSINKSQYFIILVKDDEFLEFHKLTISQIKSRNGGVIVITDCIEKLEEKDIDYYILLPNIGILTYLTMIYPLQIISYYLTVKLGYNPDKPRNLAKTITVN